jgi:serine protease Do
VAANRIEEHTTMTHTDPAGHAAPKPRLRTAAAAGLLALALGTTALSVLPGGGNAQTAGPTDGTAVALPRTPMARADFADLAARATPAVVGVTVTGRGGSTARVAELPPELRGTPLEEFFRRFGGAEGQRPSPRGRGAMGKGSGFIIDPQGYIVTNNHVVGGAERVTVELADGRELPGKVVGADPQTDIALLKVEAGAPLPHVSFGDSDGLRVGEWVVAMGNPFGLGGTATAGIVSARGRQIGAGPYDDFIQTDAPINPGNSGGPLFSAAGEVVGVNTAIFSPSGGNIGIGFAVPSNLAKRVVADLRDDGKVERGWLGVSLQPLDAELAGAVGLSEPRGALVGAVEPGSPAARGGLRAGDVVLEANGRAVRNPRDLAAAVAEAKPGANLALTVSRDGKRTEQKIALGEVPGTRFAGKDAGAQAGQAALGLALAPRPDAARGEGGGAVVARVEPGSVAEKRGLQQGDVLLRAGDRDVASPGDVVEAVDAARKAGRPGIAMLVERGGDRLFVALPLSAAG